MPASGPEEMHGQGRHQRIRQRDPTTGDCRERGAPSGSCRSVHQAPFNGTETPAYSSARRPFGWHPRTHHWQESKTPQ